MVTIIGFNERTSAEGEKFFSLTVQGGIDMVASKTTGKFYATARKCSIPSTFDEVTCKALIGQQLPGDIKKVPCDPYDFAIPSTGEVIELSHTWEYTQDTLEEVIFGGEVAKPSATPIFQ